MLAEYNKFPKNSRLLKSEEYKQVFSDARKFSEKSLLILTRPNNKDNPRLGLIIKKKHAKRATDRNRIKRIIREYFRKNKDIQGLDIVVITKEGINKFSNDELRGCISNLWKKLKEFYKQ